MNDGLAQLYRQPLGLLTDLYQLTMAQGYWKLGRHEEQTAFHMFFRRHPFGGGYTLTAGLYDPEDGARLPVTGCEGCPAGGGPVTAGAAEPGGTQAV